jgi:hypothetical protein
VNKPEVTVAAYWQSILINTLREALIANGRALSMTDAAAPRSSLVNPTRFESTSSFSFFASSILCFLFSIFFIIYASHGFSTASFSSNPSIALPNCNVQPI